MKYIFLGVIVTLFLTFLVSCFPNYDEERNAAEYYLKPKSNSEIKYFKELELEGLKLQEYRLPIVGKGNLIQRTLNLTFSSNFEINNEKDEAEVFQKKIEIANELYSQILNDLIIEDIDEICISIDPFKKFKYKNTNKKYFQYCFSKDSLEIWNGFKVIEVRDGVFKRIKV
jgi:hypothetical protein